MRSLIHNLWIVGMLLQAGLAVVLISKKAWAKFPMFTAYSLFNLFATVLSYAVQKNVAVYFYTYWICEGIGIVLGFTVVYEIFKHLFSIHVALRQLATTFFRTTLALLVCGGLLVLFLQPTIGAPGISNSVLVIEEAVRIIEVGLLMFLFVFSTAFGLDWRHSLFGIALGLGVFAAVELVHITMRAKMGTGSALILSVVRMLTFNTSLLIWIGYILVPEPITTGELPKREQLEQWNRAVMEFMHQ
ncbi:MAG TPA: hypothetical protein VF532_21450 [Candidatus Angelobacter sp.]